MELTFATILLVIVMLLLMASGLEIAISMGMISAAGLLWIVDKPLDQLAFTAFETMNSFTLTSVPLFVFMGAILFNTGIIQQLFDGVDRSASGLPGGVAHSVILANAVFGAMSGSSVAATALFGKTCYPNMERLGYSHKLSLGTIASAGTLAVLIPPSLILIVYGGWENVSVARLFSAGAIPGIILTIFFMLTIMVRVKLNPHLAPKPIRLSLKERVIALKNVIPFLIMIFIILGVIFAGIMTPTEASAMGALLSILLALAYRKMTYQSLKQSMYNTVSVTSMVAFIIFTARVLGQVFQYLGVTDAASGFFITLPGGKYVILAFIYFMYLVLGCFFDSFTMMVLTLPFISPVIQNLGFSSIWFGVVFVVLAEIGMLTPPFGLNLFVLHGVVPQHGIMTIVRSALPFLIPLILLIVLLTAFPILALWLPEVLFS